MEGKEGTRGGERKGNWEKEQMERQTESGEEEKVKQERRSVKVGMKRSSGEEKKKRKTGTGRKVPNNICEGGRRGDSCGCVREKAFQTTSVMRATSVTGGS